MTFGRVGVLALFTAALLGGCGGSTRPTRAQSRPLLSFAYNRAHALDYVDHGAIARSGKLAIHDISYTSDGERVAGFLVLPDRSGRRPAIVLIHGSGGDRREQLGAAVALAVRGAVTLTITEPSTGYPPPPPRTAVALLRQSRTVAVRDVIAIRRAADALISLPNVDPLRLGYLGWSAGAKTGALLAASDRRFTAFALLSAGAAPLAAFVAAAPAPLRPLVARDLGSVDPIRYIAAARPDTVLLEDGTHDAVVPHQALLNIVRAAPRGTVVQWYATGHALNSIAYRDAFDWLLKRLGLGPARQSRS
jgi:dienelactone hydrolase